MCIDELVHISCAPLIEKEKKDSPYIDDNNNIIFKKKSIDIKYSAE